MLDFRLLSADSEDDVASLFCLFEQTTEYSLLVEGQLPTLQDARDELVDLPSGKTMYDKFFGGYWKDGTLLGCVDLIRGYPDDNIAYLGLLLFAESHHGHGLGVQALNHVIELARSWQCNALRLAVIDKNTRGLRFWLREGFSELYRKPTTQFTGDAIILQRALEPLVPEDGRQASLAGALRPSGSSLLSLEV
jgi:GNAT superfamily N-acetyltransferase